MAERPDLDEDKGGKLIDPTTFRGMGVIDTVEVLLDSAQFLGHRAFSWSSKKQKSLPEHNLQLPKSNKHCKGFGIMCGVAYARQTWISSATPSSDLYSSQSRTSLDAKKTPQEQEQSTKKAPGNNGNTVREARMIFTTAEKGHGCYMCKEPKRKMDISVLKDNAY
ncbi:hypothetical protein Tco_0730159 [Tanacetum coccineum]|uniref:Uncharacterized protein n=1 Tax=Tanacetum coccineum TaxID=301880 RepID=A0ABQ4YR11_9ASTR